MQTSNPTAALRAFPAGRVLRLSFLPCLLVLVGFLAGFHLRADEHTASSVLGEKVGRTPLKDPAGVSHTHLALEGRVGVVIFSVPDMSQGPSQRRWSAFLANDPASRVSDRVALVLVENMALAGAFSGEARDKMKEQFVTKKRPFLLLDETGETFRQFRIPRDRTEILIFDRSGTVRDVEQDLDDRAATIARIKAITSQLLGRSD